MAAEKLTKEQLAEQRKNMELALSGLQLAKPVIVSPKNK